MKMCSSGTLTRVKQRALVEILTAEKVPLTEIHHRFKYVYGDGAIYRST